MTTLEACLPPTLQTPATTITRMAAGLSGAGVYRVESASGVFVLKVTGQDQPREIWRQKVQLQRLAAEARVAPKVIHVDEERRAVVSAFVVDRSFTAFFANPQTTERALTELGRMLRRLHAVPLPPGASARDPRDLLTSLSSGLAPRFVVPSFVTDAVARMLGEEPPPAERPVVFSHNDVNPSNMAYDGESIFLVDWDTPGPNDPFYDLGAVSVFLRMDEAACLKLLAAYDDGPVAHFPARFAYCRELVATLCGTMFLHLASASGHGGATGSERLDSAMSLGDVYQRFRAGSLSPATADGQWCFGLALVKEAARISTRG